MVAQASQAIRKSKPQGKGRVARGKPLADTRNVRRLAARLTRMNNEQRSSVPGIGPRRSEIVVVAPMSMPSCLSVSHCPDSSTQSLGCATAF